jgi:hypothetical protein
MTAEARALIIRLLREEHGLLGYVSERLGRTLDETKALIGSDSECAAVRDFEQTRITEDEAGDRASAACRRQVSTNPDIQRLAEIRLRERREEETSAFLQRVLSPPAKP